MRNLFCVDLRSLAVFRLSLGALLCWDLFDRVGELEAHYTGDGLVPGPVLQAVLGRTVYSLHMLSDTAAFQALLFGVAGVAALMVLVGWRTRLATVVSFVLMLSLHARNPLVLQASDTLIRALLMWSIFLPLGALWSVDAGRGRKSTIPSALLSVGSVALILQGFFLYLIAVVSKLQYEAWWDGRALYAVLNKASYVRPLGEYLAQFPEILAFLTHTTLFVEAAIPLLLFSPWRRGLCRIAAVLLGVALHAGIFAVIDLGTFQPLAMLTLIPALPASLWDRLGWRHDDTGAAEWARQRWSEVLVALLLAYTVASNAMALDPGNRIAGEPFRTIGLALQLDQRWRLFANSDRTQQGWWVVIGELDDGTEIDLLHSASPVSLERPHHYYAEMPNGGWRKYWVRISRREYAPFRPSLGRYFCLWWNREAEPELQIRNVRVVYVEEFNHDPERTRIVRPRELVATECRVVGG